MNLLESKTIIIALRNIKDKLRTWESIFFNMGFPIMFTIIFYLIFHEIDPNTGIDIFSYSLPGMIIYATSFGTSSAAIVFANERGTGMLERIDTTPAGRKNVILGIITSESLFLTLQIFVMFILGYLIMDLHFEGPLELFLGFFVTLLFGILCVGVGICIASVARTIEVANGMSLAISMPILFASGCLVPFESAVVYFTPPYWAKQIYLQITMYGDGLTDNLYSGSFIGTESVETSMPIWGGLLILLFLTALFIYLGIKLFQKKTQL